MNLFEHNVPVMCTKVYEVPHSDAMPVPIHPSEYHYGTTTNVAQSQSESTSYLPSDSNFIRPIEKEFPS